MPQTPEIFFDDAELAKQTSNELQLVTFRLAGRFALSDSDRSVLAGMVADAYQQWLGEMIGLDADKQETATQEA